mgnify:CR=1 FL=1
MLWVIVFWQLWKLFIVDFITAVLDFSQPVPVDIPYDYRPPASGPKSYSRPVVTINKGEGQGVSSFIGNSVCPMLLLSTLCSCNPYFWAWKHSSCIRSVLLYYESIQLCLNHQHRMVCWCLYGLLMFVFAWHVNRFNYKRCSRLMFPCLWDERLACWLVILGQHQVDISLHILHSLYTWSLRHIWWMPWLGV